MSKMKPQWDQATQAFGESPYVNEPRQARKRKIEDLNLEKLERLATKADPHMATAVNLTLGELSYIGDRLLPLVRLVNTMGHAVEAAPHSSPCRNAGVQNYGECSRCVALGYYRRARGVC